MLAPASPEKKIHHGQNIKRIREMLGVKQDILASTLGLSQQAVSQLEQKEALDQETIEKVAKALKVPSDAIKNFSDEAAVNYFNTFNDNSVSHVIGNYGTYNFNPIEKWLEALEENKKLVEQNTKLFERLLQSEREKVELLSNPRN